MTNVEPNEKTKKNPNKSLNYTRFSLWRKYLPQQCIDSIDTITYISNTNNTKSLEVRGKSNGNDDEKDKSEMKKPKVPPKKYKLKDLWKLFTPKTDVEEEDVDGFVWIKDPNVKKPKSLKWRLRKYFVQNPKLEEEKYRDGDDIMIENDFVYVGTAEEDGRHRTAEEDLKLGIIDFTAGSIGGLVQVIVSQPFDTIKVKQQMFPKLYNNMMTSFKLIYTRDGIIHGLFAGTRPAVLASIAENSVLFAAYGRCQSLVADIMEIKDVKDLSVLGNATAGFVTAFFSTFTLCPTELVKCKLQSVAEMKHFVSKEGIAKTHTAWQVTEDILRTDGIAGLYRGLMSTFAREMPGLFFFFGGYEGTRTYFTRPGQTKDDIGALRTMFAGMVGGLSLWISTFPMDVVKTRIQVDNLKESMLSVALQIIRKEGFFTLYRGLLSSVLRTIPASATLFLVYEFSKKVMTHAAGLE